VPAFLYPHGKGAMLRKKVGWLEDDIQVALLDGDIYVPNQDTDKTLADVPEKAIIETAKLEGRTLDANVCGGKDCYFPMVSVGTPSAILIFVKGVRRNASPLVMYTTAVGGLPFIANGSDFWLRWSKAQGHTQIFQL